MYQSKKAEFDSLLISLDEREEVSNFRLAISEDYVEKYDLVTGATFTLRFEENDFELSIGLDNFFPFSLPHFFFNGKKFYGIIPHVEENGWICYYSNEGLTIDYTNPEIILSDALDIIKEKILGLNKKNIREEIISEFEHYWKKVDDIQSINSLFKPDNEMRDILFIKKKSLTIICDEESQLSAYLNEKISGNFTAKKALYIPLQKNEITIPIKEVWTLEEIRAIVRENLSSNTYKKLIKRLKKRKVRTNELLLLSIPRDGMEKILIGFKFVSTNSTYPLLENGQVNKIFPYRINRYDHDFLLKRSGSEINIKDRKVLVVGLGSVGGYIASGLVESGIRNFTFVDKENFEKSNLFRHLLGRTYIGKEKVVATKKHLVESYPNLNITTHAIDIIHAIKEQKVNLSEYDLVIVAIGQPRIEFYLNEIFKTEELENVFFTWLEPYDIGGHLVKLNYSKKGCYKCLYRFELVDDRMELRNQSSFLEAGQNFEKDMEGCGTSFTPYGATSAKKTALLVCEHAVNVMKQKDSEPQLISWKGNPDQILENNYTLSSRFYLTTEQLEIGGKYFVRDDCEVCNGK